MFDELCRRLYWAVWRRLPSEDEILSRLTPEQRAMMERMKQTMEGMIPRG